jgi:hypothetical protein
MSAHAPDAVTAGQVDVDLFGVPVGKTRIYTEWATRWPVNGPGGAPPGYTSPAADEKHARAMAAGPPGAQWAPGVVVRRTVVTITSPWEEVHRG